MREPKISCCLSSHSKSYIFGMSHLQKSRGLYAIIPPPNRDFGLNPALWLCFRISHPRALLTKQQTEFIIVFWRHAVSQNYSLGRSKPENFVKTFCSDFFKNFPDLTCNSEGARRLYTIFSIRETPPGTEIRDFSNQFWGEFCYAWQSLGTVLRLTRDTWSMVIRLRQATNEYTPPPSHKGASS